MLATLEWVTPSGPMSKNRAVSVQLCEGMAQVEARSRFINVLGVFNRSTASSARFVQPSLETRRTWALSPNV
jgi:Tfp pilus assembly protein PilZ